MNIIRGETINFYKDNNTKTIKIELVGAVSIEINKHTAGKMCEALLDILEEFEKDDIAELN